MKKFLLLLFTFFLTITASSQFAGDLDNDFGINGKVTTNFAKAAITVNKQVIQPDGKIILVGNKKLPDWIQNEFNQTIYGPVGIIIRLNADGTIDNTFNSNGTAINNSITDFIAVKILSDGKIIVGGNSGVNANQGASSTTVLDVLPEHCD